MEIVEIWFSENCFVTKSNSLVEDPPSPCVGLLTLLQIIIIMMMMMSIRELCQQSKVFQGGSQMLRSR